MEATNEKSTELTMPDTCMQSDHLTTPALSDDIHDTQLRATALLETSLIAANLDARS